MQTHEHWLQSRFVVDEILVVFSQAAGSSHRAVPPLADDFKEFVDVIDELITVQSESFAVILMGRSGRSGMGLMAESGVLWESTIMDALKKKQVLSVFFAHADAGSGSTTNRVKGGVRSVTFNT